MEEMPAPSMGKSLIQAVIANNLFNVQYLVNNKIGHIELPDNCGWTSIHHAGYVGDLEILKFLLGSHSRTCRERLALKSWEEETPLVVACKSKKINPDVIYFMLASGSEVNAKNIYGQTALCFACMNPGNLKVIKMLVDMGGDSNATALHGSPICRAIQYDLEMETIQYLLQRYVPSGRNDQRLLHSALKSNQYLSLIIDKIKPNWFTMIRIIDEDFENISFTLYCRCLKIMAEPEIFFQFNSLPYRVPSTSFEKIFQAVPSDKINFELINVIFYQSDNFDTHLEIILKRLYDDLINIKLCRDLTHLSTKMHVFVSRYVFITELGMPTLKEACRKAVLRIIFSKHKAIGDVLECIWSANLPMSLKDYLFDRLRHQLKLKA